MTSPQELFDAIKRRPWNSRRFSIPFWITSHPTMLTEEELRMLSWIAANLVAQGDVVDLGAFLGGSAVGLAHGVSCSGKVRTVHSYDRFEIRESVKQVFLYDRGLPFYKERDALPLFKMLTGRYEDIIKAHKANLIEEKRPSGEISLLFDDISKSWDLNDHILKEFVLGLKPGAVIVQQDFLTIRVPWLYSTMSKLATKIEFLSNTVESSAIFGVRQDITESDIRPCLAENTSADEVRAAIVDAKKHFPDLRQREVIDAALAAYNASPDTKEAWKFKNVTNLPLPTGWAPAGVSVGEGGRPAQAEAGGAGTQRRGGARVRSES